MSDNPIIWLADNFSGPFPSPHLALIEPDGLLAAGGNLEPDTILQAYRQGIFPWYSQGQPILWWSPNPRCVLFPEKLHISRSLRRTLNRQPYTVKQNTAFRDVILQCAAPRRSADGEAPGTWITPEMMRAYCTLHDLGYAHSIECWHEDQLVGGIYGIRLGEVFFGESMFTRMKDASKVAMVYLCQHLRPKLVDAQVYSAHLESLGAETIDRYDFIALLERYCN